MLELELQNAKTDYIAMMTDVEIPDIEEEAEMADVEEEVEGDNLEE